MAEKKTTKRTPKQPKAEITKPKVEVAEPKEEIAEVAEPKAEVVESKVEGTELPADVTPFEEFEASSKITETKEEVSEPEAEITEVIEPREESEKAISSPKVAAKVKKLNPYLEDFQSKWVAILEVNGLTHKLFKGSYAKAFNAAENYNISHGIGKGQVIKIRK